MVVQDRQPAALIPRRCLFSLIVPIPMVCFIGVLATDISYWATADMMWADTSAWILAIGLLFGCVAMIAALIDVACKRLALYRGPLGAYVICNCLIFCLSFFNALVHSRDAWTSVVPMGLTLSAIVVALTVLSAWIGRVLIYRLGSGIAP
ncbi:DUF2231 domain-containing protein [Rhizobium sp. P38BS-XIX]|uniref:DUF2231 domain-containing protein n=1 Tax=Rhizobium sp. P38BS-XIX TaxID=2726740 RepID=UPI001456E4FB|nr:DUF2231 domain-containing protein [Rhizobium sp. P38BS-XIX]NLR97211.1 DUF2231 domain-containing protein [Rhizobium sp. P38BS-XIX]